MDELKIIRSADGCTYTLHLINGKCLNVVGDNAEAAKSLLEFVLGEAHPAPFVANKPASLEQLMAISDEPTRPEICLKSLLLSVQ